VMMEAGRCRLVDKNKWPWATRSKNIDRNIEWCYVQDDVLTRTSIEKWKMVPVDELKRLLEDTKFASKLDVLGPEKVKAIRDIMQGNEPEIGEIADLGAALCLLIWPARQMTPFG